MYNPNDSNTSEMSAAVTTAPATRKQIPTGKTLQKQRRAET